LLAAITLGATVPLWRRGWRRRTAAAAAGPTVGGAELELLPPGRLIPIVFGLLYAAGVPVAIWVQFQGDVNGWALLAGLVCGAGLLVNASELVPGVSYVLILTEGLVIREFGRVRTYSWQGIDNFRVLEDWTPHGYLCSVGWDTCDDAPPGVMRSEPSRRLSGGGSLSFWYNGPDELAERLQRYRDQYAGRRPQGEDGRGKRDPAKTPPA